MNRIKIRIALFTAKMKPAMLIQLEMVLGIFISVSFIVESEKGLFIGMVCKNKIKSGLNRQIFKLFKETSDI